MFFFNIRKNKISDIEAFKDAFVEMSEVKEINLKFEYIFIFNKFIIVIHIYMYK